MTVDPKEGATHPSFMLIYADLGCKHWFLHSFPKYLQDASVFIQSWSTFLRSSPSNTLRLTSLSSLGMHELWFFG